MRDISTIEKRIWCWRDTVEISKALEKLKIQTTEKCVWSEKIKPPSKIRNTSVDVLNADTLDVARSMIQRGLRPLVLNLADNCFPGGHVDAGSGAQEESLFRCTNLCTTLNLDRLPPKTYPLSGTDTLLTRNAYILKESEAGAWLPLKLFARIDVISCPGIRNPPCGPEGRMPADQVELLEKKVETIFQVAIANKNDAVVLGAIGCGAYRNPPQHVAEIMHRVTRKWAHAFTEVSFAIFSGTEAGYIVNNRRNGPDNFEIFSNYFNSFPIQPTKSI